MDAAAATARGTESNRDDALSMPPSIGTADADPRPTPSDDLRRMRSLVPTITVNEVRALRSPRPVHLAIDLGLIWAQVGVALLVFAWAPHAATFAAAWLVIGGAQHGMGMVMHEGGHYLLAPDHRRWNDWLTAYLFAGPILMAFSLYRHRHLVHHRAVCTVDDTKSLYKRDYRGYRLVLELLRSLSGIDYAALVAQALFRAASSPERVGSPAAHEAPDAVPVLKRRWLVRDLGTIIVCQGVLVFLFALWDIRLYFALWLLPIATSATLWSKIRLTIEHCPLASHRNVRPGSIYFGATETPYVRSIRPSWFERLVLTKINFHYHLEHHLWPSVSYQHLPVLHRHMQDAQAFDGIVMHFERGYLKTLSKLWRGR